MTNVYLAGPIGGISPKDALQWRNYTKHVLRKNSIGIKDPTAGKDLTWKHYDSAFIVETDLEMIEQSKVLLVDFSHLNVPYIGTSMEIMYAARVCQDEKLIYVWGDAYRESYWLRYHATEFFSYLDKALERIIEQFGAKYQAQGGNY